MDIYLRCLCHLALCWRCAKVAATKGLELVLLLLHIWHKFPLLAAENTGHEFLNRSLLENTNSLDVVFCMQLSSPME